MINGHDFYTVLSAMVPLYVAMILAYASVRWWNIFTPDQCAGINRFVAVFAVPLLSFHFISTNNPYTMNLKFIAADTLQKTFMLIVLIVWTRFSQHGSLDWLISLFSLSTLPNSLVMGIPLLVAMYGEYCRSLMVQIVVLQCIVWYTLLLFLFEYRAAKVLISDQFPDAAGSIVSVRVESDIVSLDEFECLEADGILGGDGKLRVTLRKSNSSRSRRLSASPRPSNFSGVDIYSMSTTSCNQTPRGSSFDPTDFYAMTGVQGYAKRNSSFGGGDGYSDFRASSARASNFSENTAGRLSRSRTLQMLQSNTMPMNHVNDLHKYIWGSKEALGTESSLRSSSTKAQRVDRSANEVRLPVSESIVDRQDGPIGFQNADSHGPGIGLTGNQAPEAASGKQTPPAGVMTRLILIMVWRKLVRNPNTYSSLIGLIWSLIHFRWNIKMPIIIDDSIAILSDAGLGMAMFSLGLFMALQPSLIPCGKVRATYAMCVRFITGPAVMAAVSLILGIRGELLRVAIVQAALPQGIVPFVFAKEYNVHPQILSTAVIFGMLIALPITLIYYIVLGL